MNRNTGSFITGLLQTLVPGITNAIQTHAEDQRTKMQQEVKALNEIISDASGTYSQADRDAALFALTELGNSKKQGAGLKAYEKRKKEMDEARTSQVFGAVAGGGRVAGQAPDPAELAAAPTPVIGGPSEAQGADSGGKFAPMPAPGGPPAAPPAPGMPPDSGGPAGAPPPGAAALPATSPVVSRGTAAPPPQPVQGAPQPPAPPAAPSPAPAPAGGPQGAQGGPPGPQDVEAYGKGLGMQPPARPTAPQRPDPYYATKLDVDFYKQDMLAFKSAEDRYAEWMDRVASIMHQDRQAREGREHQTKEREAKQAFEAGESKLQRESAEKRAKTAAAGRAAAQPPEDKEKSAIRRTALSQYQRELNDIEGEKSEFGMGKIKPEERERRRRAAADNYREVTGEDPPGMKGGRPVESSELSVGGGKKLPGGPPEAPADLAAVPNGAAIRRQIEGLRRQKVDAKEICAQLEVLGPSQKAAAKAYARCP